MPQWEYKVISSRTNNNELNKLGEQGWEMVGPMNSMSGNIDNVVMKRPKTASRYSGPDYTSEDYYMGR